MFRRWFDAVGLDPADLDELIRQRRGENGEQRRGVFDGPLERVMRRLDTDQSPEAVLDAAVIYNQFVEGVLAIAGYQRWEQTFQALGKLPGLQAGLKLTQRDERRHIAYGTYLARRVLSENPELWGWLEERWAKLTATLGGGYGADPEAAELAELHLRLSKRRLEALAVARTMNAAEVDSATIESFEPVELQHVT
jgi:ribonucleotide reductase beta subunit family protein with ferritin-like domain